MTGSGGFIGGHLVAELERRGWAVRRADLKDGVDVSLHDALDGFPPVDVVFHLAALTGVRQSVRLPLLCQRYNVLGTASVLEWCRKAGVQRVVFASSSSVYGDGPAPFREGQEFRPMSPYAASKAAAEQLCSAYHRLYGLHIAALRYFTVYGPNGRRDMAVGKFKDLIAEGRPIVIYGDGMQSRDFTYVGDVVGATIAAAAWDGWNVVNVGRGQPETLLHMVALLEEAMGAEAEKHWMPPNPADVPMTWADAGKLRALAGWEPVSLAEGISRTVELERMSGGQEARTK